MKSDATKKARTTFLFGGTGVIASLVLAMIVAKVADSRLWYFSFEYWVRPTFLNFTLANLIGLAAVSVGILIAEHNGWIPGSLTKSKMRKVLAMIIIVAVHPTAFWVSNRMDLYPISILLACVILALSISFILWILTGAWSNTIACALLLVFLITPNIAPVLGSSDTVQFIYPSLIPFVVALCGYWLATPYKPDHPAMK